MDRLFHIMSRQPRLSPDTPLTEVCALLEREREATCVVVQREGEAFLGLFQRADALALLSKACAGEAPATWPIVECLPGSALTATPGMSLSKARERMLEGGQELLAVLDSQGACLGVVTLAQLDADLLESLRDHRSQVEAELRKRLQTTTKERNASQRLVRKLHSVLATENHSLRSVLSGMVGVGELVLGTPLERQQQEWVATLVAAGQAVQKLIHRVDPSSGERDALEALPLSIYELVEGVAELITVRSQFKGVELRVRLDVGPRDSFYGDLGRLRQVLQNLCEYAVQSTEVGEVVISAGLVPVDETRAQLHIAVRDTGRGLTPAEQAKLLYMDASAIDGSHNAQQGLVLAAELIDAMGSCLHIQSARGEGSVLSFQLEVELAQDSEASLPSHGVEVRALVVDSEPTTSDDLRRGLVRVGVDADAVSSPAEALAKVKSGERYMLLFVRFPLAERSQRRELEALVDWHPKMRIWLVTTTVDCSLAMGVARYGYEGVLTRPVRYGALVDVVCSSLGLASAVEGRQVMGDRRNHVARGRARILLAEDNTIHRKVTVHQLRNLGYRCVVAPDGEAALESYRSANWDLILLDARMPKKNGHEVAAEIRAIEKLEGRPGVALIGLTAADTPEERERCRSVGMDDVLTKPIHAGALGEVLRTFLRLHDPAWLPPLEQDAIKEMMNIGVGRGAAELSEMLGVQVQLYVPSVCVVTGDDVAHLGATFEREKWVSVQLGFDGALRGTAGLMFSREGASSVVAALEDDNAGEDEEGVYAEQILTEIGNIVLNGVVGSFCNVLGQEVGFEVPYCSLGTVGQLMASERYFGASTLVLARTRFTIEALQLDGLVLVALGLGSFEQMLMAVRRDMRDCPNALRVVPVAS